MMEKWLAITAENPCYKYVVVRKGFEHPEIAAKIISVMFDSARYDSNACSELSIVISRM